MQEPRFTYAPPGEEDEAPACEDEVDELDEDLFYELRFDK